MTDLVPPADLTNDAPVGSAIGDIGRRKVAARVPADRYTSAAFAESERADVWPHAWLMAGTVDHLPDPGDFLEFEVDRLSVLIVRDNDGLLRAYQNACLHRGNVLCTGTGSGLTEIRCPYHRWSWELTGKLREIPSRRGFGPIRNEDLPLIEVQVDTWGPLIFINLDLEAEPLTAYLGGIPGAVAWANLDDYHCRFDLSLPVPCNWKTLIDGFSETYHVQGIHREMLASVDDVNSENRLYGRHGMLLQPYGIASPRLRNGATDAEIWDSLMRTQGGRYGIDADDPGPLPVRATSESMRDLLERVFRAHGAAQGLDYETFSQTQLLDLFQVNLFPNITVIVMADTITCMRARPGPTPDDAFMDVISLQRSPVGADVDRPARATLAPGDASFGMVLDQDVMNMQRVQRGLHQPGLTHLVLSREEMRIMNLHRNLEQYMGIETAFDPETVVEIDELRAKTHPV